VRLGEPLTPTDSRMPEPRCAYACLDPSFVDRTVFMICLPRVFCSKYPKHLAEYSARSISRGYTPYRYCTERGDRLGTHSSGPLLPPAVGGRGVRFEKMRANAEIAIDTSRMVSRFGQHHWWHRLRIALPRRRRRGLKMSFSCTVFTRMVRAGWR
jgi:hypothetical protein